MKLNWSHTAVLGAAGKMGSGIALLLLLEMAWNGEGMLTLVDVNEEAFPGLLRYLRDQVRKNAERGVNRLREKYAVRKDLIDNGEMIEAFVAEAMDRVRCVTTVGECRGVTRVFEAIVEDVGIKGRILKQLDELTGGKAWYFTNTSSIPISVLGEAAGVTGRIVGFHFYNPPAVQKLLEMIYPDRIEPALKETAEAIAKRLDKTVVFARDVAGFIGNGHFIREIVAACKRVSEWEKKMGREEALCSVNYVSQEFLIRPMGIFQLIDYVGVDVCAHIGKVMGTYLGGDFVPELLEQMLQAGRKGGQHADGAQKEGIFRYDKGAPVEVYDLVSKRYVPYVVNENVKQLPEGHLSWKAMAKRKDRAELLKKYLSELRRGSTWGCTWACQMLDESRAIAEKLVSDGVARSLDDVDTVLMNGFYHLYGVSHGTV